MNKDISLSKAAIIAGIGLIGFGLFYLMKVDLIDFNRPDWILKYWSWIIPSIFILRAIGDFIYVGFLKKVKKNNIRKIGH